MANPPPPAHYKYVYVRNLMPNEIQTGTLHVKLDPYRIAEVYGIGGGAREQILKKALRWTTKGDSEQKVIKEIMQACTRRLEMLDEDRTPVPPPEAGTIHVSGVFPPPSFPTNRG